MLSEDTPTSETRPDNVQIMTRSVMHHAGGGGKLGGGGINAIGGGFGGRVSTTPTSTGRPGRIDASKTDHVLKDINGKELVSKNGGFNKATIEVDKQEYKAKEEKERKDKAGKRGK